MSARFFLDDQGRVARVEFEGDPRASLRRLVTRTQAFLSRGRFALREKKGGAGSELLVVRVTVTRGAGDPDADEPRGLADIGHRPPKGAEPGQAHFVRHDGLRMDAEVRVRR